MIGKDIFICYVRSIWDTMVEWVKQTRSDTHGFEVNRLTGSFAEEGFGYEPSYGECVIVDDDFHVALPEPKQGAAIAVDSRAVGTDYSVVASGTTTIDGCGVYHMDSPRDRRIFVSDGDRWYQAFEDTEFIDYYPDEGDWDPLLGWGSEPWETFFIESAADSPEGWADNVTDWYHWDNNIRARYHPNWEDASNPGNGGLRVSTRGESIADSTWRGPTLVHDFSDYDTWYLDLFFYETSGGAQDREARILLDGDEVFYDQSGGSGDLGDHTWSNNWEYHEWEISVSTYDGETEIDFQLQDLDGTSADSPTFAANNFRVV